MVTKNELRTCERKNIFLENNLKFTADLNKCLKQVKVPIVIYKSALISEEPSDMSAMLLAEQRLLVQFPK